MIRYFDTGTIIVILITLILFILALFLKGLTKDLLLEAGVLLVSIKLILMAYRTSTNYHDIKKDLDEIKELLKQKQ
jgi:putative effector of murein hydrolase